MSQPDTPQENDERSLVQAGYRFALSLTHHPERAEDIVQEACFRVITKKGRLRSRSYLFKAIRNLFVDIERRKKVVQFEPLESAPAQQAHEVAPGVRLDLDSELERLDPEERSILFLNCVEGYTADELGQMLGKPRSTILNILSRARAKIYRKDEQTKRSELI